MATASEPRPLKSFDIVPSGSDCNDENALAIVLPILPSELTALPPVEENKLLKSLNNAFDPLYPSPVATNARADADIRVPLVL